MPAPTSSLAGLLSHLLESAETFPLAGTTAAMSFSMIEPCSSDIPIAPARTFPSRLLVAIVLLALLSATTPLFAVTPESPEVKAVIEKGVKYLEGTTDMRPGGNILIGLACLKAGREKTHPKVKAALQAVDNIIANEQAITSIDNYTLGLAIIVLCETDPEAYRPKVESLLKILMGRQLASGGWTYQHVQNGDTSQTQYAVLGLWMAKNTGFDVPLPVIEKATGWLIRVQDLRGGYIYQPADPGGLQRAQYPDNPTPSLSAAGVGSLYMCAHMLGINEGQRREETGVPSALKVVGQEAKKKSDGISKVISADWVRKGVADGNQWFVQNYTIRTSAWNHYYLYGLERYQSFRELAEGAKSKNTKWYDDGFDFLRQTQAKDGSWHGEDNDVVATALSVLFLTRSSGKSISKIIGDLGEGTLLGGMGLPPSTADLKEKDGKLETTPLSGTVDELLRIIEDPENPALTSVGELPQAITLDPSITKRSGQINKLRSLVSSGSFQTRLIAVRALGQSRDYGSVPVLLYALTDPDVQIVREADKALRIISRKFQGVGLSDSPSKSEIDSAITQWKAWYLSIRPDAELLD